MRAERRHNSQLLLQHPLQLVFGCISHQKDPKEVVLAAQAGAMCRVWALLGSGCIAEPWHGVRDRCGMPQGCSLTASTLAALVLQAGMWVATS